jgi:deoxyribodipyrimidine photo-lyase
LPNAAALVKVEDNRRFQTRLLQARMDPLDQMAADPRVMVRRGGAPDPYGTCVVYWMQRAQRSIDNPALDVTIRLANLLGKPAVVFFAPVPLFPANLRHYAFLADGIPDIAEGLQQRNVGFVLRKFPDHSLIKFCQEVRAALVVGDENQLREQEAWRLSATEKLQMPLWTVDADVIVPSKLMEKEQYAARTIRPRLLKEVPRFLVKPENPKAKIAWKKPMGLYSLAPFFDITQGWQMERSIQPVKGLRGGMRQGLKVMREFVSKKLKHYREQRNHPELDGTSRLSPYLHFGHVGPMTVAHAVQNSEAPKAECEAFLEQLIVWRELAVNFVKFNSLYDSLECAEPWALRSLALHAKDPRPVLYSERQLENAETDDPLWNAAQMQMVDGGWMHNYMRMYWVKKILEWTPSPVEAYQMAVRLNDKYEMDGRDPNGYAGIAWAIAGKFDRPWFERRIFGQIRYMSLKSTGKKFNSKLYIEQQNQRAMSAKQRS